MTDQTEVAEPDEPESRFLVSQGLRLHYLDWGNPQAPLLLLQHGGQDHARSWDRLARALRGEWHVVCPDLRGHGDSAWSPDGAYLMPYLVLDLARLIDHVAAGAPVTVVGHSLGGAVALHHAGAFPERIARLVAMEGLGLSPDAARKRALESVPARWRGWIEEQDAIAARAPRRYDDIAAAAARMHDRNPHLSAEQAHHLTLHGLRRGADGGLRWKFDPQLRSWPPIADTPEELHALWRAITCPVLLCHGADSWASNPAEDGRAAHFGDARVVSFAGAGHWMHHDRYEAFAQALDDFLNGGAH